MTTITAALAEWRPRDNKLQSAFEDGWEARDAMTCVWEWNERTERFHSACRMSSRTRGDFCPNCGGRIEEK